jgi:hypothetical protein
MIVEIPEECMLHHCSTVQGDHLGNFLAGKARLMVAATSTVSKKKNSMNLAI